jgi:branched-chain amino acid aminotransferase
MTEITAYYNGEWMPQADVRIMPFDRGFYVGDAVFDLTRTFDGRTFKMAEHVDRLYRSLKYARIETGLSQDEMVTISEEGIRRNEEARLAGAGDWHVWQAVTRGMGVFRKPSTAATVMVFYLPLGASTYAPYYRTGAHGVITRTRSYSPESLDPKIKHYSRMNFNIAEQEAFDIDPEGWPILLDTHGNLSEGNGYNVFLVSNGVLKTPKDDSILQGVSRGAIYELADRLGIPVSEEALQPYDLYTADEAFITNTPSCMLPVTKVDNRQIGDGKPGPITEQLLAAWSEWVGVDIPGQMEALHAASGGP